MSKIDGETAREKERERERKCVRVEEQKRLRKSTGEWDGETE